MLPSHNIRALSRFELCFCACCCRLSNANGSYHLCCYCWCARSSFRCLALPDVHFSGGKFAIKHVPTNLRRILSAESAANDGLAYPFLTIAIYLTVEASSGVAVAKWFLVGWLCEYLMYVTIYNTHCRTRRGIDQVILGTILGAVMGKLHDRSRICASDNLTHTGLGFCQLMKFSHRHGLVDRESYVAQYLALALFTIGVANTIGSDDLLAAFAAGLSMFFFSSFLAHFWTRVQGPLFPGTDTSMFRPRMRCFLR